MRKVRSPCLLILSFVDGDRAGFPPSDRKLHDFLLDEGDVEASYRRAYSFMVALFQETTHVVSQLRAQLTSDDDTTIAEKFRLYMNEGQTMAQANVNRLHFYDRVVSKAKEVRLHFETLSLEVTVMVTSYSRMASSLMA